MAHSNYIEGFEGVAAFVDKMRDDPRAVYKFNGAVRDENGIKLSDPDLLARYVSDSDFAVQKYRNAFFMMQIIRGHFNMNRVKDLYLDMEGRANIDLALADRFSKISKHYKGLREATAKMFKDWCKHAAPEDSEERWKKYAINNRRMQRHIKALDLI